MLALPAAVALLLSFAPVAPAQVDPARLAALETRSIGPAAMSGRVASIDAVHSDPNIIYVGAATGGVWKTTNGGVTWRPIFDEQPTSSIGAVAVFQPNPNIVWVGTGEGNPRNSAGVGTGLYKSLDGGATWSFLGLGKSERIHRVVLHPTDPNVAYVGAMGPAWSEGEERGVYRTRDGGKTWEKVLYVNEKTGVADLVMDPRNPNKLFAAMWQYRRWPWFFESGGPGSGLYVTQDGGSTWTRLGSKDGLPEGELGRIGVAIARSNTDVVYALVEAKTSALLRSADGGRSWTTVNNERGIANRPFYYTDIRVDPQNENRVYNLFSRLNVSEDGGRTFHRLDTGIHGDNHELWIHPGDGRLMINGNDGGVGISYDRGQSWRFVENLPLGQYYHINVDMQLPYNVYGGLQDNGSWRGPSSVWESGPILNQHWTTVGGGDGFGTLSDPADPDYGYSMSQGGNLRRFNFVTGERKDIKPYHPDGTELRFNWNAGIAVDPFDAKVVYYGSQFLHRSPNRGDSWEIISPDLTTNDSTKQKQRESGGLTRDVTGAENHTTILAIAPSPLERSVLWVGTDDGNVQLTRDGGRSWTNVVARIRGVPPATWVPHLEASRHDAATAFVVFDNHRRGDWTPYIYRTTDYGRSWTSLATPELSGFIHVIEQDPVVPELLYLGTEFGLYVSVSGGRKWFKWTHGFPTVPVQALIVHPRDHDLVVGTHGRAVYILDDVRPLRELARDPALVTRPLHLFEPPAARQYQSRVAAGVRSPGHGVFRGENRPFGALLTFWSKDAPADSATIEVLGSGGEVIRTFRAALEAGANRVAWNLRRDRFRRASDADGPGGFGGFGGGGFGGFGGGPEVLPG
ncbi:MAG: hypothetical protein HY703_07380, partial [Gemmatimonadetes bacterium]|nr:hypothetical protein [Gemmatimonadota bacterium]